MRIERLENSKHKQERVLVYLEDGTLLRITGAELLQFGLYQGLDLPPETLEELRAAARRSDTRRRGASMASGRMLSKKELTERLTKKGASPDDAAETADWLEDLGAVDDAAYAGVIVRHYGGMGYGAARVRQELHRRGVPKELWDEALEQLAAGEGALSLPEGVEAVCRGGVLTLCMAETAPEETVLRRGENPYGAGYLVVSRSPMEGALALRCGAEQRLTARCWRREDRLTLPDGRGARSLKRLMAERGVRPENRRKIPVLCVDGVAAAAWGIGVDRSFLPEPSGEGIYYIIMRES